MDSPETPVILTFSPHDPTGCGGQSADIETAVSLGCHAATVVTALTARDTREIKELQAVNAALIIEQARALLEDMPVTAIKIGELSSVSHCEAIHSILLDYPQIKVVIDASAQSIGVHRHGILQALQTLLLPQTTLLCARQSDLQQLAPGGDTTDAKAQLLLDFGCKSLLVSRCRQSRHTSVNKLYLPHTEHKEFELQGSGTKLEGIMGASATLATAAAAYLAHGCLLTDACHQAQQFAWQSVQHARRVGMGKLVPNRLFWATEKAQKKSYKH